MQYVTVRRSVEVGQDVQQVTERLADQCAICGREGGTTYYAETDTMVCPAFVQADLHHEELDWAGLLAFHRANPDAV